MSFISYLINGLGLGSVYAIIALGYTMVYGIAKMLNFAHGDVIMIGAYVALMGMTKSGMSPVVSVLVAMVVCTVLGVVIERIAYKPFAKCSFAPGRTDHSHRRQLPAPECGSSDLWSECTVVPHCSEVEGSLSGRGRPEYLRGDDYHDCGVSGDHGGSDGIYTEVQGRPGYAGGV